MKNNEIDPLLITEFIDRFGFGTLFSQDLQSTHLPLLYQNGVITGHMARSNGQAKLPNGERVKVVFNGPHSYISPTWYTSRPAVSTWNYAALHFIGRYEALNSSDTLAIINALISKYEPEILGDQTLSDDAYIQKLLKAVCGFQIIIEEAQLIEKLGQHKKSIDQQGVFEALIVADTNNSRQLANYMKGRGVGTGQL
ncbi:FMN-binding negative transcriptional regulator [Glaciecola sp. KUL10]|uniref:FMN-binding negative transcriptional regulator n=1 Tax=Glaciecola sp. (strain KUL10) TaxID=2161813 RepID=UPI000D78680C|nr:FMN-binding negative transcriptional regulator [Glaciecola sp. KUL10]GBL05579.1 negative transcriptional regulator [Glaciecola sp. KUL10]